LAAARKLVAVLKRKARILSRDQSGGREPTRSIPFAKLGFTPQGVLRPATMVGAELMGMQESIGSLEAGKLADVAAVEGDPLHGISALQQVVFAMKGGVRASR
jgi:imidazolonepropionase-like amidohydrolase